MILAVPGRSVSKAETALRKIGESPFRIGTVIVQKRGGPRVDYR